MKFNLGTSNSNFLFILANTAWCSSWGIYSFNHGNILLGWANVILTCVNEFLLFSNRRTHRAIKKLDAQWIERRAEIDRLLASHLEHDDITKEGKHDA